MLGLSAGGRDGSVIGTPLGSALGPSDGEDDGAGTGIPLGNALGKSNGGDAEGRSGDGAWLGRPVGRTDGSKVVAPVVERLLGMLLGPSDGLNSANGAGDTEVTAGAVDGSTVGAGDVCAGLEVVEGETVGKEVTWSRRAPSKFILW